MQCSHELPLSRHPQINNKKLFRIFVVIVSLLYCLKQNQSISFGPGLLKSTVCVEKEALFSLEKESLLLTKGRMLQGLGITGMRRGIYLALANSLLSVLRSLEQRDTQTAKDAQSPTCKPNTSVIKRSRGLPFSYRSSALCYTHLYRALHTSIQNKSFGCL